MHRAVYERQKKKEKGKKKKEKKKRNSNIVQLRKGMVAHKHPSSLVAPKAAASSANGLHIVLFISRREKVGGGIMGRRKKNNSITRWKLWRKRQDNA